MPNTPLDKLTDFDLRQFLSMAYWAMDAANARERREGELCRWCFSRVYDGNGVRHVPGCIILQLREVLDES